jgi:integrase
MLYKRPHSGCWWVRFTAPDGHEIRRSTRTEDKNQAQEYEDRLKSDLWRIHRLGERPRYTWQDAVVRWLGEQGDKASLEDDRSRLRWMDAWLRERKLDEIARGLVDRMTRARKAEGVANATVNRMLEVLRAILRKAERDWGWLDRAPIVHMLPEPIRRIRWLTRDEAGRLLSELPAHLADMARFSLATGLREANVTRLEWSQVDLERRVAWIHADQAKARRPIGVPLNAEAVIVLRQQVGRHGVRVFTYRETPVAKAGTHAWKRALQRAGIRDFRWHDLRHTWASWHVQAGTPLQVLQELGG